MNTHTQIQKWGEYLIVWFLIFTVLQYLCYLLVLHVIMHWLNLLTHCSHLREFIYFTVFFLSCLSITLFTAIAHMSTTCSHDINNINAQPVYTTVHTSYNQTPAYHILCFYSSFYITLYYFVLDSN